MIKITRFLLLSLALLFVFPVSARAVYFQSGDTVTLEASKTVNESVFVSGKNITIGSTINGDLYCAGERITITGTINGDILCAGQVITVNGQVNGNLRTASQNLDVTSTVNQNITSVGQDLNLTKTAVLKKDVFLAGQNLVIAAPISRDLAVGGQSLTLDSSVSRNAIVATRDLKLDTNSKISGNLDYYYDRSQPNPEIDKAKVLGSLNGHPVEVETSPVKGRDVAKGFLRFHLFASVFSGLLLGFFLILFARHLTQENVDRILRSPLSTLLIGIASLILIPVVIVVLAVSLVGLPISFFLLFVYFISLMLSISFSSIALGRFLLSRIGSSESVSLTLSLILGILIVGLLLAFPIIGALVAILALCFGLGAFYSSFLPAATRH